MSTGVVIALIAVCAVLLAGAVLIASVRGGGGIRRRFGPEYDRVLARHNGDSRAARHELAARVRRHGSLSPRPLPPERTERYAASWADVQQQFVDAPRQAVGDAEQLLAELAAERGYPPADDYAQQVEAFTVHHAHHAESFRELHSVSRTEADTEQLREALLRARALYEALADGAARPVRPANRVRGALLASRGARTPRPRGGHPAKGSAAS